MKKKKIVYLTSMRAPEHRCPGCFTVMDALTGVGVKNPKPEGALCVCCDCGAISVIEPGMKLRLARQDEIDSLSPMGKDLLAAALSVATNKPKKNL